jgi:hypothetical protein
MVASPVLTAVARPLLLTVATAVLLEVHVAMLLILKPEPSDRVAVAMNWTCVPELAVCDPGVTVMLWMAKVATVKEAELEVTLPDIAVMVVVASLVPDGRLDAAVAMPELLIVASEVFDEFHVTESVASPVELLPYVACAVNAAVPPVRT